MICSYHTPSLSAIFLQSTGSRIVHPSISPHKNISNPPRPGLDALWPRQRLIQPARQPSPSLHAVAAERQGSAGPRAHADHVYQSALERGAETLGILFSG